MVNKQKSLIITNIENGMQQIVFNRPEKKNAFISQMYKDIIKILNESANNDAVTTVVITGNGDFYSSGNDFLSYTKNKNINADNEINIIQQFVESLILYPKLLIAVVNGPAIGIAATTLALFDIVYATNTAYFMTPFCKLGLSPEGCSTYTFPRIFGPSKAGEILYFGEKLSAKEALRFGFVSKIYKSNTANEIWTYLKNISSFSKESLIITKRLLTQWNKNPLIEVNKQELIELKQLFNNPNSIDHVMKYIIKKSKL
ncbi:PREDICTED: enoyl-CoA delta isomerase 2, mitochondrial [Ceratosolen solmsi marchali]|uniref:Enoyl-CoA delta isomerase 2, mitochondrial n=1 Tax=Ceratosolen solmsi marchali TaxID=326594 RepID=A0AAJ6YN00_9HYME|nr:PREDICTED: enoyl-CoA delta isomerase 2, mitochondrial [Ceratosolen solmsi marchali]